MEKIVNALFIDELGFAQLPICGYVFLGLVILFITLCITSKKFRDIFF